MPNCACNFNEGFSSGRFMIWVNDLSWRRGKRQRRRERRL